MTRHADQPRAHTQPCQLTRSVWPWVDTLHQAPCRIFVSAGPDRDALKVMPELPVLCSRGGVHCCVHEMPQEDQVRAPPASERGRQDLIRAGHEVIVCQSRTRVAVREFRRCGASRTQV
jgi:hypothetical protein